MAKLTLGAHIDIGCDGYHNATSWQVALDENFTQIIDETIKDPVNLTTWHSMLPKISSIGYYADLDQLHARVKIFIDDYESPWYYIGSDNQNKLQPVVITETGVADILTDSITINMQ